ncbi:hypothetical protein [Leptospira alexanderi]|uniref:DUF4376 domain-containing protein n=1 Tax=Leptospira alexanderi TaxID=100053 RepID=UPI000990C5BD|nr:hypothetical protein [Leptospira alexanderi]
MNYLIDKESKKVVWVNPDPNRLAGESAWSEFDSNLHQIIYALHYNPHIGEFFKATVENGIAKEFEAKKVYNTTTMAERILLNWGDELDPANETEAKPLQNQNGDNLPFQIYSDSGWIIDISKRRKELIRSVDRFCELKIIAGFDSSALGEIHHYESDREDQLNLIGSVSLNSEVLYKCTNSLGLKEYRTHSASEIKQVLNDGAIRKVALLQRAYELKSFIKDATKEEIEGFEEIDICSGWE